MSNFKFNIGDIVEYKKGNYRIIGRTEFQLPTAKGSNHENTYSLTPVDGRGNWFYDCCLEHHLTLKESSNENREECDFKYNLGDMVFIKEGGVFYKIVARQERTYNKPLYELMRTTDKGYVYFEAYSEQYIKGKVILDLEKED